MLTVELTTLARRPRTWLLITLTLVLPAFFLIGSHGAGTPATAAQDPIAALAAGGHRWAMVLAALLFGSPVFLPIAVAVVSGTAIGADASSGYLRYLLVRPVTTTRVYLTRLAGAVAFCVGVTTALVLLGTMAALVLAPNGPAHAAALPADPSTGADLVRGLAAVGYVALWLTALASIGVLAGVLTRSAVGGVGLTIGYHLVASVLTQVPVLRGIHPALLPYWLGRWTTVGQAQPHWASLTGGAVCGAAYVVACTLIGLALLRHRDVTE